MTAIRIGYVLVLVTVIAIGAVSVIASMYERVAAALP